MSATDIITVGDPLPRIKTVTPAGLYSVTVEWADGNRNGFETVDLAPYILSFKLFRSLRDAVDLFDTVHVAAHGSAITWGEGEEIAMSATSVEQLAEEVMTSEDFAAFLKRNNLTLEGAAGLLGISRRIVAYYAKNRAVPRYIALACRYLEIARTEPRVAAEDKPIPGAVVTAFDRHLAELANPGHGLGLSERKKGPASRRSERPGREFPG
jgi:hypothetical protein